MSTARRNGIVITNLEERAVEKDRLSPKTTRDRWRIVDYELAKIGCGTAGLRQPWSFPIRMSGRHGRTRPAVPHRGDGTT